MQPTIEKININQEHRITFTIIEKDVMLANKMCQVAIAEQGIAPDKRGEFEQRFLAETANNFMTKRVMTLDKASFSGKVVSTDADTHLIFFNIGREGAPVPFAINIFKAFNLTSEAEEMLASTVKQSEYLYDLMANGPKGYYW